MGQKIFQIDEYKSGLNRRKEKLSCYCAAMRAGQEFFAKEVHDLRRCMPKPSILLLDSLDYGVPSSPQGWDFIYSPNLLAGLPLIAARQVLRLAISRLKAGGRLLVANVCCGEPGKAWRGCAFSGRNYRTELDMADLTLDIPDQLIDGQAVFRDDSGLLVCLELYKAAPSRDQVESDQLPNSERVIGPAVQQNSWHNGHARQ